MRWGMGARMTTDLVSSALVRAVWAKRPRSGLIHHSDRGVQYCAQDYQDQLRQFGLIPSMSRKGNCYDNAPMESFWGTLKNELVHHRRYDTREQARREITGTSRSSIPVSVGIHGWEITPPQHLPSSGPSTASGVRLPFMASTIDDRGQHSSQNFLLKLYPAPLAIETTAKTRSWQGRVYAVAPLVWTVSASPYVAPDGVSLRGGLSSRQVLPVHAIIVRLFSDN